MAFLNKIGNMLKNSAVKHINQDFSASTPSLFQAIRSMSSAKIFVGGISFSTDDMSLRESFARYGEVIDVKVIMDRETGRSRGFGFVTFATSEDASSAIQGMDGQDLHGRRIRVNYATERSRPGFGDDGGYGSGGGYNRGGNYGSGGGYSGGGDYNRGGNYGSGGGYGGGGGYNRGGNYGSGGGYDGGGDYNRGGNYGSGGYNVTSSYSGGNAETSYTGGANDSNYQFNENSGGDIGSASSEFSSNQNDTTGADNDEFIEPLEDNVRENNDEPTDYAQNR